MKDASPSRSTGTRTLGRRAGGNCTPSSTCTNTLTTENVLEALVAVFGCGHLRPKGGASSVWTYAVDSLRDLERAVLPFFERYPPVVKADDFRAFATIVRWMRQRFHLTPEGFEHAVRLAYAMNANGRQRDRSIEEILGSSETARQAHVGATPALTS